MGGRAAGISTDAGSRLRGADGVSVNHFQTLVLLLFLLGPVATVRAGIPMPTVPIPQRVALADAVVVGTVTGLEEQPVRAYPLLKVRGGHRVAFTMAQVRVDRVLLGSAGPGRVRVGVGPGPNMPTLAAGQEGCFFLHRHPEEPFCALSAGSDFIDSRRPEYGKAVALAGRCAGLLGNPDEGLRSRTADDRLLAAALLIFQFRTVRSVYTGAPRTEPIEAGLSRRILAVLHEGPLADEAAREPTGRLTLFLRLGLTEADGWVPPPTLPKVAAAAEKWLDENASTYRIRRYIPEDPVADEAESTPSPEGHSGDGSVLLGFGAAVRRHAWVWISAVLVCLLAAAFVLSRRRAKSAA
jgi:hypothetical protein